MKWLYMRHGLIQRIFITDYYLFMIVIAVKLYYDKWTAQMHCLVQSSSTALSRSGRIPSMADSTRFQSGMSGDP